MNEVPIPDIRVGEPSTCGVLSLHPLYLERTLLGDDTPNYLLSDEAIAGGGCVVREMPEPKVEEVLVENAGDRPVLFVEGEMLSGAKQNRVLRSSVLVQARSQIVVPVYCTQRRRWDPSSANFKTASQAPPSLRLLLKEGSSRRHGGQVAVWRYVNSKHRATATSSSSENMSDVLLRHPHVAEELRQLRYPEGACGVAVAINGRTVGIDLFDEPSTLEKLWNRMVLGLAPDYLDLSVADRLADEEQKPVRLYIDSLRRLRWQEQPTVGAGRSYTAVGSDSLATALVFDGRLLHLSLSVPVFKWAEPSWA